MACPPRTCVRGFLMSPLRGWALLDAFRRFATRCVNGMSTSDLRPRLSHVTAPRLGGAGGFRPRFGRNVTACISLGRKSEVRGPGRCLSREATACISLGRKSEVCDPTVNPSRNATTCAPGMCPSMTPASRMVQPMPSLRDSVREWHAHLGLASEAFSCHRSAVGHCSTRSVASRLGA